MNILTTSLAIAILGVAPLRAETMQHDHHEAQPMEASQGEMMQNEAVEWGDLTITHARIFATLPNQPAGGGYLQIENHGEEADRLISASAEISKTAQIHEMSMQGDIMKMQELPEGIEIPAGEALSLEPGGFHIMFMGLNAPLKDGETVDVTLHFEKAGEVVIPFAITKRPKMEMEHNQNEAQQ